MTTGHQNQGDELDWDDWRTELQKLFDEVARQTDLSSQLLGEYRDRITAHFDAVEDRPKVVNAGILNAGKSTLFNAIVGEPEVFPTAGARRTVRQQTEQIADFTLVDTPGLDSQEQDEDESYEAYRQAQVILFVHSAARGEFDRQELEFLANFRDLYPDPNHRRKAVIPVLTKSDGIGEDLETIEREIEAQWSEVMEVSPNEIFTVRAETHLEGLATDKPRLCEYSRVPALKEHLEETVEETRSVRRNVARQRINKELEELVDQLSQIITARQRDQRKLRQKADEQAEAMNDEIQNFTRRHRDYYDSIS